VIVHPSPAKSQEFHDPQGRRFPQVVDVFLLGHAQDQDVGFLQALLAATVKRTQTSLLLQGG
jgi:hypothetical protein